MRHNAQRKPKEGNRVMLPNGFQKAYYNCTIDQMDQVRDSLTRELGWTNFRFYNRMRGIYSFTQEEVKAVEIMFKAIGLDAWTGEKTFADTNTKLD